VAQRALVVHALHRDVVQRRGRADRGVDAFARDGVVYEAVATLSAHILRSRKIGGGEGSRKISSLKTERGEDR